MRKFGLIGYPLSHSFSQKYFSEKFARESIADCSYTNYPIETIEELPRLLEDNELTGLNVTIPYKTRIISYLTDIDRDAQDVGAVNVVKITRACGKVVMRGFNSDIYGFRESIVPVIGKEHEKALILGTGGASLAVGYVLGKLGIPFLRASILDEPGTVPYSEITGELLAAHRIIINATPLGMYPAVTTCPDIPYNLLGPDHLLYDLVYNPEITLFMEKGKERGCTVVGGLKMLHLQAERSWQIWNDEKF